VVAFTRLFENKVPSRPSTLPSSGFCAQPAFRATMTVAISHVTAQRDVTELTIAHILLLIGQS
jgi:hypothetical protein